MSEAVNEKALVIFSGGQDSTTCLLWAKKKFSQVDLLNFHYGQRHSIEEECALKIARMTGLKLHHVDLSFLQSFSSNALTDASMDPEMQGGHKNLPSTFVVGRNALFLTVAVSWGLPRGIHHYVFGACQVDFSGYPDCREDFVRSQEKTLSLATDSILHFHTPLMFLTKEKTFELADQLGGLDLVIEESHTCYLGDRRTKHDWGYGCGRCPACKLRKKGFENYANSRRSNAQL